MSSRAGRKTSSTSASSSSVSGAGDARADTGLREVPGCTVRAVAALPSSSRHERDQFPRRSFPEESAIPDGPVSTRSPRMRRFRQRCCAWIAIFAALLGALAPTVSRATARDDGGGLLVAVCTAAGTHWIALDRGAADDAAESGGGKRALSLDRCPYCFVQAGAAALPAPSAALPLIAPGWTPPPLVPDVAPRPRESWPPSHSRAPPGRT